MSHTGEDALRDSRDSHRNERDARTVVLVGLRSKLEQMVALEYSQRHDLAAQTRGGALEHAINELDRLCREHGVTLEAKR